MVLVTEELLQRAVLSTEVSVAEMVVIDNKLMLIPKALLAEVL